MNRDEALSHVLNKWLAISEKQMGRKLKNDDDETEEYEWGWVFVLCPIEKGESQQGAMPAMYACDRETGYTTPIGTKGLRFAVDELMMFRERRRDA